MTENWDLSVIYSGLDDPKYEADIAALQEEGKKLHEILVSSEEEAEKIEKVLTCMENSSLIMERLGCYLGFSQAVDGENGLLMAQMARVMRIEAETTADQTAASKLMGKVEDLDGLCEKSPMAKKYRFMIEENQKKMKHLLGDEVEAMIASMDATGGGAWGKLQSYLTSTVKVDYEGKVLTLSEVRNLAYDDSAEVRKKAYEAELAAYDKIQDSVAFAINNIKNQVNMLSEKRGYESPLAMTLEQSRMSRKTLDAMMQAIQEYLPELRKYLKKKAQILGYQNGLPFYELFAPLGKSTQKFSLEEAKEYLMTCFETISPEISSMMGRAFDESWIDFYPKKGKEGGAFCGGISQLKQSRIMTNYDGTFSAVDTLAHELGHAFHNQQVETEPMLLRDYPMPVAETASTFNEVHLGAYASAKAKPEERLALLENELRESIQCVVDIYSRYLFESAVFEQSKDKFLMASDLNQLMIDAQKKSYGDGLDPEYLNPGMWICKGHYYSSGLSFYNFPYAFGNLFAHGLYALYLEKGEDFMPEYKEMLRLTTIHSMEENGAQMGIDLTSPDFWRKSLQMICSEIEEFCQL